MTIEEKAKAYDEALEQAQKELAACGSINCDAARQIFRLFPQLRESEDERARKAALEGIEYLERKLGWDAIGDTDILDVKEYLEKQKESLHISEMCKENADSFTDIKDRNIRGCIGMALADVSESRFKTYGVTLKECLAWLEKQKEQKPVEWSENVIRKAVKEVGLTQHQIDWFKTNVFPPKQEWSEEDERLINTTISFLKDFADKGYENAVECIDWLKSLRPSWKPTEEQMKALLNAEGYLREGDQFDSAKSIAQLYEQLKKL